MFISLRDAHSWTLKKRPPNPYLPLGCLHKKIFLLPTVAHPPSLADPAMLPQQTRRKTSHSTSGKNLSNTAPAPRHRAT